MRWTELFDWIDGVASAAVLIAVLWMLAGQKVDWPSILSALVSALILAGHQEQKRRKRKKEEDNNASTE